MDTTEIKFPHIETENLYAFHSWEAVFGNTWNIIAKNLNNNSLGYVLYDEQMEEWVLIPSHFYNEGFGLSFHSLPSFPLKIGEDIQNIYNQVSILEPFKKDI